MATNVELVDLALKACGMDLGAPELWIGPESMRESLALCVVESIQAPRSHYTSVRNVLERYREFRFAVGGDARADGTLELLATFEVLGGPAGWGERIGNRKPVSTRPGAPRKAQVIHAAAELLRGLGVDSAGDLRNLAPTDFSRLRARWTALPGQSSGLSWRYFAVQTGIAPVADDPLVREYLGGTPADELLVATAGRLGVEPERLAYALWRRQTGRPVAEDAHRRVA